MFVLQVKEYITPWVIFGVIEYNTLKILLCICLRLGLLEYIFLFEKEHDLLEYVLTVLKLLGFYLV